MYFSCNQAQHTHTLQTAFPHINEILITLVYRILIDYIIFLISLLIIFLTIHVKKSQSKTQKNIVYYHIRSREKNNFRSWNLKIVFILAWKKT